jgi:predicted dehydrogenase
MNIVIIGCGQIVTHHIDAIFGPTNSANNDNDSSGRHKYHHHHRLLAVCDPSPERRQIILQQVKDIHNDNNNNNAAAMKTTTTPSTVTPETLQFNTLEDLIEYSNNSSSHIDSTEEDESILSLIDIILIAVPHDLHESIAIRALEVTAVDATTTKPSLNTSTSNTEPPLRRHRRTTWIVLEKPIAVTESAIEQLHIATIQYQYRLIIAEQSPYWPALRKAHQLIHNEHAIGSQIISIASYYYESMRDNITSGSVEVTTGNLGWRGSIQRAGGGIMIDGGLHWIRPIREICDVHRSGGGGGGKGCANTVDSIRTKQQKNGYRISKVMGVLCPIPSIQAALGMEGETLGHALLELTCKSDKVANDGEITTEAAATTTTTAAAAAKEVSSTTQLPPPIIATYSACMLPNPAVMAYDRCPYLRITGTTGELIIAGTGLQKHVSNAGGLRLYNPQYPHGKEMLLDETSTSPQRTDFFMAFHGLWDEIRRIRTEQDEMAAYETVIRAMDDVRTVLAIYRSAQTQQWECTGN